MERITMWGVGVMALVYGAVLEGVSYGIQRRLAPVFCRYRRRAAVPGLGGGGERAAALRRAPR